MNVRGWWARVTHRGAHRAATVGGESIHAVSAAARTEQAKLAEALARQHEAEAFLRKFRHTFGVDDGHGGRA